MHKNTNISYKHSACQAIRKGILHNCKAVKSIERFEIEKGWEWEVLECNLFERAKRVKCNFFSRHIIVEARRINI